MSDRKRKLAGVLSLGALAAGTGSTASATWYNPLSWGVEEKLKNASENVKTLIKGSEVYQADNKLNNETEIKRGYAAAINIAERIYNVLNSKDKEALINKLKDLCIDDNTINEQIKNLDDNLKKPGFSESISSYASFLISIAHEIGIEKSRIEDCFKKDIGGKYVEAGVESSLGIKKIVDDKVTISNESKLYSIFVGQTLTLSKKSTDNSLFEYISNTEFSNEKALLKAIDHIKKEIFDTYLKDENDGSKAKKLIASLIINKYKNNKDEQSYKKIIDELLDLEVSNKKKFKQSDYVTYFRNKKIEKSIDLKVDPGSDLDYILSYATSNEQADNIFSEETKNVVKRIADNKITRLVVTGTGAYAGMALASALGLGLIGTTLLASGTASAANAAIDYISDKNARTSSGWSINGIGARYSSFSTCIPMTLAAISAKIIISAVRSLYSDLFSSGKQ